MDVSQATSSLMDLDELLPRIVQLVKSRFDLYYVGLFLLDEQGSAAILQAGTGEAGRAMLAENWRLPVDGRSMIGMCVATGEPLSKQLEGEEVIQFENPHLSETRSELALPLHYGDEVIGAMTVQSQDPQAFNDTDIAIFQNMADQVAVAVENARLFSETQSALARAHRVQQRYQTTAWSDYLGTRSVNGYDRRGALANPIEDLLLPETESVIRTGKTQEEDGRLTVPIMQGDEVVGVLGIEREAGWASEDVALVEALADQLALAANNQRLLDETMRREARERMRAEAAARMREPLGLEEVLKTAGREICQALGMDELVLRLVEPGPREPEAER
jgi:GAF domain-containing protein